MDIYDRDTCLKKLFTVKQRAMVKHYSAPYPGNKTIVTIADFGCGGNSFAQKITRIENGKKEDSQVKFRLDAIDFLKDITMPESSAPNFREQTCAESQM